jgi:hypothetical protein
MLPAAGRVLGRQPLESSWVGRGAATNLVDALEDVLHALDRDILAGLDGLPLQHLQTATRR